MLTSVIAVTMESKLTILVGRIWLGGLPAGPSAAGCAAGVARRPADGPHGRSQPAVTTDRRRGASPHRAHMAARGSGRPSPPAAPGRPASPESTVSSGLWPVVTAQAGRTATYAAPDSMIAESWTSQPRRAPCPRRFVVIYRRRQREGHGRHGRVQLDVMIFSVSQTLRQSHREAAWR